MAEQRINLPLTSKSTDSDVSFSRRNSTGKASSSRSGEKFVPSYLRASTGSCHDFCKYGREHTFEKKDRRPFIRRYPRKPSDEENSSEIKPEGNKMVKAKHKPNSNTNTPPKTPEVIKCEVSPESLDRQSRLSSSDSAAKKMSSRVLYTKSANRQGPVLSEVLAKKKTAARETLTESVDSQRSVSSENQVASRKASAQGRKKMVAMEVLTKSIDSQSSISGRNSVERRKSDALERTKMPVAKLGTSPHTKTHLTPNIVKRDFSSPSEKLKFSSKQASSNVREDNVSAKHINSSKLKVSSSISSRVSSTRGNNDSRNTVTSKIAGKGVQPTPKSLSSSMVRGQVNQRSSLSLKSGLKLHLSPRVVLSPKTSISPSGSMSHKSSLSRAASLNARKHKGSQIMSPLRNQSKIEKANNERLKMKQVHTDDSTDTPEGSNNHVAQEKTLYVIKMETENKFLESDVIKMETENKFSESDHEENLSAPPLSSAKPLSVPESSIDEDEEESEYTTTDVEDDFGSEYDETEYIEEAYPEEGEQKGSRRHRKARMLHSEDKNNQPVKLRFRRGRVIEMQPDHNSPRRLKFRQRSVTGENQNVKAGGRISFKRRGAEGQAIDRKPNSEKVVLRHQDEQEKKDAQGLFNNVIEETASKLVETRKSKVKALVGAFETVISLQDNKPLANTASS